eukprot:gene15708-15968_t
MYTATASHDDNGLPEVLRMYLERMKTDKGREVSYTSELTLASPLPETTDIIAKLAEHDARSLTLKEMLALLKFLCNECLMDNIFVNELVRMAPDKVKELKQERLKIDSRQKEIAKEREEANAVEAKTGVDIDADAALAAQLAGEERRGRRVTRTISETPVEEELREKKEAEEARAEEDEELTNKRYDVVTDLFDEESRMRSRTLGYDRNRSRYTVLHSAHGIYVQHLSGAIGVLQKPEDLDLLVENLNERGLREKALKEKLTEEYSEMQFTLTEASKKVRNRKRSTGAVYGVVALAAAKASAGASSSSHMETSAGGRPVFFAVEEAAASASPASPASPSPFPPPSTVVVADAAVAAAATAVKQEGGLPAAVPAPAKQTPSLPPLPESRQFFENLKNNETPQAIETWLLKANKANILTFNQDVVDGGFGWAYSADWVKSVKTAKTAQELAAKLVELEAELDLKYVKAPLGRDKRSKTTNSEDISETIVLARWRQYAATVRNTSQLSLLYELIWASMRWEKSSKDAKCKICRKSSEPESMLMCDSCDTGFHMFCLSPRLMQIPKGDWHCKGCRPPELTARKAAQQKISSLVQKRKATNVFASSTRGGQREEDLKKAAEIWKLLRDHPDAFWFMEPAMETADLPDYLTVVKTPMDLGTVKRKIDSVAYDDAEDFAADVRLVFDNCAQYNHVDTEVAQHGRNVEKLFAKLHKKFFGAKQHKSKKSR